MMHVALLRGINVGGKNPVPMARLKTLFIDLGYTRVRTYINSGNVVFWDTGTHPPQTHAERITAGIRTMFGLEVPVVMRSVKEMAAVNACLRTDWVTDQAMRCEVLYLWPTLQAETVLEALPVRAGIDAVIAAQGAIIWQVDRKKMGKSGLMKLAAHPLYQQMTLRNANTTRKLYAMMLEQSST
ncbi:MAG: DUF1697 domain-containing protein [Acholeplasmatales bacterium]|nr:MAG: DUF1697 domain-containing protein [Acholeplasmatales bacterium]